VHSSRGIALASWSAVAVTPLSNYIHLPKAISLNANGIGSLSPEVGESPNLPWVMSRQIPINLLKVESELYPPRTMNFADCRRYGAATARRRAQTLWRKGLLAIIKRGRGNYEPDSIVAVARASKIHPATSNLFRRQTPKMTAAVAITRYAI